GRPVVIKPRNGNQGRCVTVEVNTPAQAGRAYRRAAAGSGSSEVIVETYVPGKDYRVLVTGGRVSAAAELRPATVTGDGTSTVMEVIDALNADPRPRHRHPRRLPNGTL